MEVYLLDWHGTLTCLGDKDAINVSPPASNTDRNPTFCAEANTPAVVRDRKHLSFSYL